MTARGRGATPETTRRPRRGRSRQQQPTARGRIITATLGVLADSGYSGTTARVVATAAKVPVGSIFYYFQTLDGLMLAVLDHTSAERLPRWREALADISEPAELLRAMAALYAEDGASGHAIAVRELVSNGAFSERFGAAMAARMEPWLELAETVATRVLRGTPVLTVISARDLALTAIALYVGLDVVSRVTGTTTSASALFAAGERMAPMLAMFTRTGGRPRSTSRRITLE